MPPTANVRFPPMSVIQDKIYEPIADGQLLPPSHRNRTVRYRPTYPFRANQIVCRGPLLGRAHTSSPRPRTPPSRTAG